MPHDGDHERVIRWLLGLAERQVTAAGSRATFVSDMYFEAAERIEKLAKENALMLASVCAHGHDPNSADKPKLSTQEIASLSEQLDRPVDWAHFVSEDFAEDYAELMQEGAQAIRQLLSQLAANAQGQIEEEPQGDDTGSQTAVKEA